MRIIWLSLAAFVLAASQTSGVHGQAAGSSRASVLSGMIQSPICSSDNFASGDASGDLSGSFYVAFDCRDGAISGGTWLILVTEEAPDGTLTLLGTIRGQVLNGSFEADGTGEYASVMVGTGSLEATSDPDGAPQFQGTLGLTF